MSVGYWGSKKRFASDIADVLCRHAAPGKILYEPFCGMASVGMEVLKRDCFKRVVFSDLNEDVIVYWHGVAKGWCPSTAPLTDAQWTKLKTARSPSARRSFYGFDLGWGGHFLAGRSPCASMNRTPHLRNARIRVKAASDVLRSRRAKWSMHLRSCFDLNPVASSVVYLDPPYELGTTDGGANNKNQHFSSDDMDRLWGCVRTWLRAKCVVYMSSARKPRLPPGLRFVVVKKWDISNRIQTSKSGSGRRTELLFRIEKS